ncbi:MAG: hypothetical protein KDK72_10030, partial [Chlamydiia bacterium]|nr:hypothetical protein [Chlamydiia bacterium]
MTRELSKKGFVIMSFSSSTELPPLPEKYQSLYESLDKALWRTGLLHPTEKRYFWKDVDGEWKLSTERPDIV